MIENEALCSELVAGNLRVNAAPGSMELKGWTADHQEDRTVRSCVGSSLLDFHLKE